MYLEHCKLWTKDQKYAEKCATDYTQRFWKKYVVIFKAWLWHHIVTEEKNLPYFKDKGIVVPTKEIVQLSFLSL